MRVSWMVLLVAGSAACTPGTRPEQQPNGEYRFDLQKNFFATQEVAERDRRALMGTADQLRERMAAARSAYEWLALLAALDTLQRGTGRQYAYLSLRGYIDTRDSAAAREMQELANVMEPVYASAERRLGALTAAQFDSLARVEPRLAAYRHAAVRARREAGHQLGPSAQNALASANAEATTWGPALFQRTMTDIPWGTVATAGGELHVVRNGNQIRSHRDRAVRAQGYRLNLAGVLSRADTFAMILSRQAAARQAIAHARGWPDYPTQAYASWELTPGLVEALLAHVTARGEMNKAYERTRVAELRRRLGVDTVQLWDLTAPEPEADAPRFTIQEASAAIVASVAPLGEEYVREMRALLDPANGRLDLVPRPYRSERQGFSTGSVGYPSMFFQGRFEGYVDDVLVLAHEAGHAVQNMFMERAGVLPRYAWAPAFFTESYASFNEFLLLDHLRRTSPDPGQRRFFHRRLVENALEVFRTAYESTVELQLFDSVAAGRSLDAAGMETLMRTTAMQASVWFGEQGERRDAWIQPTQFFTWPLYRANYTIAKLLALRYFGLLQANGASFRTQYGMLLSNGYDAPPDDLLQEHLDFALTRPAELVGAALGVITAFQSTGTPP